MAIAQKVTLNPKATKLLADGTIKPLRPGKYKLYALLKLGDHSVTSKPIGFTIADDKLNQTKFILIARN